MPARSHMRPTAFQRSAPSRHRSVAELSALEPRLRSDSIWRPSIPTLTSDRHNRPRSPVWLKEDTYAPVQLPYPHLARMRGWRRVSERARRARLQESESWAERRPSAALVPAAVRLLANQKAMYETVGQRVRLVAFAVHRNGRISSRCGHTGNCARAGQQVIAVRTEQRDVLSSSSFAMVRGLRNSRAAGLRSAPSWESRRCGRRCTPCCGRNWALSPAAG